MRYFLVDKKKTLTLGSKVSIENSKKNDKDQASREQVRQTFSHGRSKTVEVETKKKRIFGKAFVKNQAETNLTGGEKEIRFKALKDSIEKKDAQKHLIEENLSSDQKIEKLSEKNAFCVKEKDQDFVNKPLNVGVLPVDTYITSPNKNTEHQSHSSNLEAQDSVVVKDKSSHEQSFVEEQQKIKTQHLRSRPKKALTLNDLGESVRFDAYRNDAPKINEGGNVKGSYKEKYGDKSLRTFKDLDNKNTYNRSNYSRSGNPKDAEFSRSSDYRGATSNPSEQKTNQNQNQKVENSESLEKRPAPRYQSGSQTGYQSRFNRPSADGDRGRFDRQSFPKPAVRSSTENLDTRTNVFKPSLGGGYNKPSPYRGGESPYKSNVDSRTSLNKPQGPIETPIIQDPHKAKVVKKPKTSFEDSQVKKQEKTTVKVNKRVINRVLSGDEEQKERSIAATKRARQKQKRQNTNLDIPKVVKEVVIPDSIIVSELANRMAVRGADVIKELMKLGMMVTLNQTIDGDTAEIICSALGHVSKRVSEEFDFVIEDIKDSEDSLVVRPPVVTIMGHVDHGKTSLLDALRETDVVSKESGGITQHIGAYQVTMSGGQKITFVDTPGHAAFSSMRARGANITDIVVLVVAADDGIKEQTVEAISHAKAAGVPIVLAINKIDKHGADPEKVKSELLSHSVVVEGYGGDVISVEVSAKNRINLEKLEEAILLQAEILSLKANPNRVARGVVIEARMDKGRGAVATVLIQKGTLKIGDCFVSGTQFGKVRVVVSDHGENLKTATPSCPVEILGFDGIANSGDDFCVVENESRAREIAEYRERKIKEKKNIATKTSLEKIMDQINQGSMKELAVVVKTDVHGSLEAIMSGIQKLSTSEVSVRILYGGVGPINESDVTLARASDALIIGFNVRSNAQARDLAKRDDLDIRYYSIIYDVIDDVKSLLSGLLSPTLKEEIIGNAQVRAVFSTPKVGKVAGCMVLDGIMKRGAKIRLLRDNIVVYEGDIKTLRRFKDDVKEVKENYECGISFENYQDVRENDVIECFEMKEIARTI